jgi:cytochrome c553
MRPGDAWFPGTLVRPLRGIVWSAMVSLMLSPAITQAQSLTGQARLDSPPHATVIRECQQCHGDHGEGSEKGAPRLAGMNPDYLAHALSMFKDGTRASEVMQPIARTLSDAEMHDLAAFFSTQHPPLAEAGKTPLPSLVAAGKQLAMAGNEQGVPACFSCHGPQGKGNGARYPSIAGEPYAFVVKRLQQFQARAKTGTPKPGSMTEVASKLTAKEIDEAAAFFSVLNP